jgi:hypothetical protein
MTQSREVEITKLYALNEADEAQIKANKKANTQLRRRIRERNKQISANVKEMFQAPPGTPTVAVSVNNYGYDIVSTGTP